MTETDGEKAGAAGADGAAGAEQPGAQEEALQAAVYRRLVAHLQARSDVQNIDLMNLAGFCRNCLSRWYQEEAERRGRAVTKEAAREAVYGMPYETWKASYQTPASAEQKAAWEAAHLKK